MPRYKYITPFYCWYRFNPAYAFSSYSIEECAASALGESLEALILVNAECVVDGRPHTANVYIQAWQAESRSADEIIELIDQEIDAQVAHRTRFGFDLRAA
ncbi:MAG TPA: hypothetical protein PLP21_16560 [Pyrinomonadaceae bacterium]|nr:hypothetical protein [Pyrinomonadaceae bacterium]